MSVPRIGSPSRLPRASFVRSTAVIASGSVVAQIVPILMTPVLTRLYSPSLIGILALYLSYISFVSGATTLGYSQAIVSARDEQEANNLLRISGIVVIPASLACTGLLWLMIARSWLGYRALSYGVMIPMFVSLVLTGTFFTLRYWLLREGRYRTISSATIAQSVGRSLIQVVSGLVDPMWAGLIAGEVVGRGLGMREMWKAYWATLSHRARAASRAEILETAATYRKFPLLTLPSSLLDNLALALPILLVSSSFGIQVAGQYAIANRILLGPMALVGASVGDVFHNRIATYAREEPAKAQSFLLTVSAGLLLTGLVPTVVVALFGRQLWMTILGARWEQSGLIAAVIVPMALAQFIVSPVSRIVLVYQGQEFKIIYDFLAIGFVVAAFRVGHTYGWRITETLALLAWSQALLYVLYFLLLVRIVQRANRSAN